jgi:hypothetical protein
MSTEALEGHVGSHTVKGHKRYRSKKRRNRNAPGSGSAITIYEIGAKCEREFAPAARGRPFARDRGVSGHPWIDTMPPRLAPP